jgi:DNA-binding NarL/FixJ family response regulator
MYLYERIWLAIRRWLRPKAKQRLALYVDTLNAITQVAEHEHRAPEEVANQILEDGLRSAARIQALNAELWQLWERLSPRERDVAALICLNYTTRQIAAKLHVRPTTIVTHARNIMTKFGIHDRNTLRMIFKDWDFSMWEE